MPPRRSSRINPSSKKTSSPIISKSKTKKVVKEVKVVKKAKTPPKPSQNSVTMKTETDADGTVRCSWCTKDPDYLYYHDNEWGFPVKDDRLLFELLVLEGAQAGLNWLTILKKRKGYKEAFDNFDAETVAGYSESKVQELISNPNIIRNKLKINSAIVNAKAFLEVQKEFAGSFANYLWQFAPESPTAWKNAGNMCRATSPESEAMSADLKKRGFRFVGPTICYALMQSIGMVNDHHQSCFLFPKESE
ncbi:UNVERIFIED_CONTAM: hypothetical protein HDU68_006910 [Siphonaria sp. JEL0065]|nr:hypothetical protein HDU68_006910 [Siphonaria sp. JEL0065]